MLSLFIADFDYWMTMMKTILFKNGSWEDFISNWTHFFYHIGLASLSAAKHGRFSNMAKNAGLVLSNPRKDFLREGGSKN